MSVYLIDNDALIRMNYMPPGAFPSAWALLEKIATEGRLIICKAVWEEYTNDTYKPWFEARKSIFLKDYSPEQFECLAAIGEYCGAFVDSAKPGNDADQPLVALAMAINDSSGGCFASGPATVVTFEKRSQQGSHKVKIPDACDFFGIEAIDLYQMIEREGPI